MNFYYETDRLILKILDATHAPSVLRFLAENKNHFEPYEPLREKNFYSINYQRTSLNVEYNLAVNQAFVRFWIYTKDRPNKIIGTCSFHNIRRGSFQTFEIGYKFDRYNLHKGYAYESLQFLIHEVSFKNLKFHRVEALVLPENTDSQRLLARLGFTNEGMAYSSSQVCGIWRDQYRYSLINSGDGL